MDLEKELSQILIDYTNELDEDVKKAAQEAADETVDLLKSTSPKDRPEYYKGWGRNTRKSGVVVRNKDYPGLTHILEKGHVTRSGSRVEGQPHIKPAEEFAKKRFNELIEEKVSRK